MGSWVLATNACSSGTMRIRWNIELFRKEVLAHARMDEHLGVLRTALVGYVAHYCSPLPPVNGVFPGYGANMHAELTNISSPTGACAGYSSTSTVLKAFIRPCGSPAMAGGCDTGQR